jgi:type II secretory pathway component PulM
VNVRQLWDRFQRCYAAHSPRDRGIMAGVGVLIGLSLVYLAMIEPLLHYRRSVAEDIADKQEELEHAARFLAAADTLRAERDDVHQRLEQAKQRLLPAGSGTLGAAALQERANAIAAEKGITVQSTQVMKEEVADPFRKVSIRLTISGELKPFSEFLAGLECGPQQLTIPFLEVSRRGAVAGAKGPRTLSATVEVSGYLLGEEARKPAEGEAAETEGDTTPPPAEGRRPPSRPSPARSRRRRRRRRPCPRSKPSGAAGGPVPATPPSPPAPAQESRADGPLDDRQRDPRSHGRAPRLRDRAHLGAAAAPIEVPASAGQPPAAAPPAEPHEKGKRGANDKNPARAQQTPAMMVAAVGEKDLFDPSRRPPRRRR